MKLQMPQRNQRQDRGITGNFCPSQPRPIQSNSLRRQEKILHEFGPHSKSGMPPGSTGWIPARFRASTRPRSGAAASVSRELSRDAAHTRRAIGRWGPRECTWPATALLGSRAHELTSSRAHELTSSRAHDECLPSLVRGATSKRRGPNRPRCPILHAPHGVGREGEESVEFLARPGVRLLPLCRSGCTVHGKGDRMPSTLESLSFPFAEVSVSDPMSLRFGNVEAHPVVGHRSAVPLNVLLSCRGPLFVPGAKGVGQPLALR